MPEWIMGMGLARLSCNSAEESLQQTDKQLSILQGFSAIDYGRALREGKPMENSQDRFLEMNDAWRRDTKGCV